MLPVSVPSAIKRPFHFPLHFLWQKHCSLTNCDLWFPSKRIAQFSVFGFLFFFFMNVVDIITSTVKSLRRPVKKGFVFFSARERKSLEVPRRRKVKVATFV